MTRKVLLTALTVASLLLPTPGPAAEEGLTLAGLEAGQLNEGELGHGTSLLVVWASWSPRCRDIPARVDALAERWSSQARVVTIVFQEEPAAVRTFLNGRSLAAPTYLDADGAFSKKHAVTSLPGLLIIKDGETVFRGKLPSDPNALIARTLNG